MWNIVISLGERQRSHTFKLSSQLWVWDFSRTNPSVKNLNLLIGHVINEPDRAQVQQRKSRSGNSPDAQETWVLKP